MVTIDSSTEIIVVIVFITVIAIAVASTAAVVTANDSSCSPTDII